LVCEQENTERIRRRISPFVWLVKRIHKKFISRNAEFSDSAFLEISVFRIDRFDNEMISADKTAD